MFTFLFLFVAFNIAIPTSDSHTIPFAVPVSAPCVVFVYVSVFLPVRNPLYFCSNPVYIPSFLFLKQLGEF